MLHETAYGEAIEHYREDGNSQKAAEVRGLKK